MYQLEPPRERHLLWLLALTQFTLIMDFMVMIPLGPQIMQAVAIGRLSDQYGKQLTFCVIGGGSGEGGGWMMLRTMRPAAVSCIMTAGLVISGSPHEKESV